MCSDIKASHILVQADGSVHLSGFRHSLSMTFRGQRQKSVHDFPDFYVNSLNWASRELLEQVRFYDFIIDGDWQCCLSVLNVLLSHDD